MKPVFVLFVLLRKWEEKSQNDVNWRLWICVHWMDSASLVLCVWLVCNGPAGRGLPSCADRVRWPLVGSGLLLPPHPASRDAASQPAAQLGRRREHRQAGFGCLRGMAQVLVPAAAVAAQVHVARSKWVEQPSKLGRTWNKRVISHKLWHEGKGWKDFIVLCGSCWRNELRRVVFMHCWFPICCRWQCPREMLYFHRLEDY